MQTVGMAAAVLPYGADLFPPALPTVPLEPQPAGWGYLEGLVAPPSEEVDMVEVGDRVVVESEKVGTLTRGGVVMAVGAG
jgi:hypothetical protein